MYSPLLLSLIVYHGCAADRCIHTHRHTLPFVSAAPHQQVCELNFQEVAGICQHAAFFLS